MVMILPLTLSLISSSIWLMQAIPLLVMNATENSNLSHSDNSLCIVVRTFLLVSRSLYTRSILTGSLILLNRSGGDDVMYEV